MIYVIAETQDVFARDLVMSAFIRSFTRSQVSALTLSQLPALFLKNEPLFLVLINPSDEAARFIAQCETHRKKCKIILLGQLSEAMADYLHVTVSALSDDVAKEAVCVSAPTYHSTESALRVTYEKPLGECESPIKNRAFLRYDFTNEWNNLGYGAITADHSIWSLSQLVEMESAYVLANVYLHEESVSAYAATWEKSAAHILWFNRAVGVIDSQEWRLIEYFFASFDHASFPCLPCVSEIPAGFDMAITMRLDCDEDIESSRELFNAYQKMKVPFSLAIHTKVLADASHQQIMLDVIAAKGSILSHSATHPVNWGGSYDAALQEAETSLSVIQKIVGSQHIRYAVSPFHQTPLYALQALARAGYAGCIGGIVNSDPEFLIARGGELYDCPQGFIGHSQSCMLHGDCLLEEGDALAVYKKAVDIAKAGRALFGFLDHPFSPRYAYGWQSESDRVKVHEALIAYIREQGTILFLNENDALDFIRAKANIYLSLDVDQYVQYQLPEGMKYGVVIEYRGKQQEVNAA